MKLTFKLFAASTFLFSMFAFQNFACADCLRVSKKSERVVVELCPETAGSLRMQVTTSTPQHVKTVINAIFEIGNPVWKRVWVASGDGRLNSSEQAELRELANNPPPELQLMVPLLSVLSDFLDPNTSIEGFDPSTMNTDQSNRFEFPAGENKFGSWTPICSSIGQQRFATYRLKGDPLGRPHLSLWTVGDPATACKGRCGFGCGQLVPQHRAHQYTQECLNHDVCFSENHHQLGPCADAFWMAAASYVFAPDCK